MFRFANSYILWLLLLIPALIAILFVVRLLRQRALHRFGNPITVRSLMPDVSSGRFFLKNALFIGALFMLILAAARPQFGSKLREENTQGIELMLLVDVSNSMLAEDLTPNRLDRTKYAIDKLFTQLIQDRVGMIVFAGEAKVQLPITSDYRMARSFAKKISADLVQEQGTDLGKALSLANLSFSQRDGQSRAIILITDGETHDPNALEIAKQVAQDGIAIYAIGIGTPEGAPIKVGDEFIKDEDGEMVVTKLNEELLRDICQAGKGGYIRATSASFGLDEIVDKINEMEKGELSTIRFEEYNEHFYWLIAAAIIMLILDFIILQKKNHRLSRFNIFS